MNRFPVWFGYWQQQGIEKTRAWVEKTTEDLKRGGSIAERYVAVNVAVNESYQSGPMLEYVSEATGAHNLNFILNVLTEGDFVEELDPILRETGVVLPPKENVE